MKMTRFLRQQAIQMVQKVVKTARRSKKHAREDKQNPVRRGKWHGRKKNGDAAAPKSMLRLRGAPRGQPKCNNDYVTASSSSSSSLSVVGACHLGRQVLTMRAARLQISAASCRCQCFCSPMALEPPRCLATAVAA